MSKALDKITSHFNDAIANNLLKGHIDEWDLDFYYYPTYPMRDEVSIMDLSAKGKVIESVVETIIIKARDENGDRMFTNADKTELMRKADSKILIKMAGIINNVEIDDEDLEKN